MQRLLALALLTLCSCATTTERYEGPPGPDPVIEFDVRLGRRIVLVENPTDATVTLHIDCDLTIADVELAPRTQQAILAQPSDRTCRLFEVR